MKRWLPQRLAGRLLLLILLALLLGQVVPLLIVADERREQLHEAGLRHSSQRLAITYDLLTQLPESSRPQLLRALSSPQLHYRLAAEPGVSISMDQNINQRTRERLLHAFPEPRPEARFHLIYPQEDCEARWESIQSREERRRHWGCQPWLEASLRLDATQWLNLSIATPHEAQPWAWRIWSNLLISACLITAAVIFFVRQQLRPLKTLSEAARRFALGQSQPLQEQGPEDIREVIHAFNQMQEQVGRQLKERALILAALSHDLRTPLTQMRLRLELLPEGEDREKLIHSLEEMQQLTAMSLDFVRGHQAEPPRSYDLAVLLASLSDDYQDQGQAVSYQGPERFPLLGQPQLVKRLVNNLITNALHYAGSAELRLEATEGKVCLVVQDRGPGIPPEERAKVLEPFYRLEASRARHTGGTGLGLAIAHHLVQQTGGQLRLTDRLDGHSGLRVEVGWPQA